MQMLDLATTCRFAGVAVAQTGASEVAWWPWAVGGGVGLLGLVLLVRWVVKRAQAEGEIAPRSRVEDSTGARGGSNARSSGGAAPAPLVAAKQASATAATDGGAMARGLEKTRREGFIGRIGALFKGRQLDASLLEELETVLYTADIGVNAADKLLAGVKESLSRGALSDPGVVWGTLRERTRSIVEGAQRGLPQTGGATFPSSPQPYVVMVVGVNGTGKTTTIGKIASRLTRGGHKVLLVAADTFRAAAVDQLAVWAERSGVELWRGPESADPASVAFDGVKRGAEGGFSAVIIDTAGRLHTSSNLVKELEKVHKVAGRALPGAPHEVWLVLDATMGQNALQQARTFTEAVRVSSIVLTKLDGTAKGGVVIGICDELRLPIRFVGVGEGIEDIRPFDVEGFLDGLYGEHRE